MDVFWVVPLSIDGEECPQVSHSVDEAKQTRVEFLNPKHILDILNNMLFPLSGLDVSK